MLHFGTLFDRHYLTYQLTEMMKKHFCRIMQWRTHHFKMVNQIYAFSNQTPCLLIGFAFFCGSKNFIVSNFSSYHEINENFLKLNGWTWQLLFSTINKVRRVWMIEYHMHISACKQQNQTPFWIRSVLGMKIWLPMKKLYCEPGIPALSISKPT